MRRATLTDKEQVVEAALVERFRQESKPPGGYVEWLREVPSEMKLETVELDGHRYRAVPARLLPFTNVCLFCVFRNAAREAKVPCYGDAPFSCDDGREDSAGVVFERLEGGADV